MYLIKFAYDGTSFEGFSREKNKITVEGSILDVLKNYNISNKIYISSRTDKHVSALGNVFGLKTDENIEKIFGILNSKIKNAIFYAYANVDDNFKPRYAEYRWYRYFLLNENFDINELERKSKLLLGEHDFSKFSKSDGRNTIRKIYEINMEKENDFLIIDIKGQSFLWNMVRRMVGYIAFGQGDPFNEYNNICLPAENLILMDVHYNVKFYNIKIKKNFNEIYNSIATKLFLYRGFKNIAEGRWGIEPQ